MWATEQLSNRKNLATKIKMDQVNIVNFKQELGGIKIDCVLVSDLSATVNRYGHESECERTNLRWKSVCKLLTS
jgi:hypothetical protein